MLAKKRIHLNRFQSSLGFFALLVCGSSPSSGIRDSCWGGKGGEERQPSQTDTCEGVSRGGKGEGRGCLPGCPP